MSDRDLALLARTLDLSTHMQAKMRPDPTSPGVVRLDHFSGLFLKRGATEGEWVLEARTWGSPAAASVHEWHLLAAGAARQLDASAPVPERLPASASDTTARPVGRAANKCHAGIRRRLVSAPRQAVTGALDPESRAWLSQLRATGPVREAAIGRLHALLLGEARHEVRRRTAALAHPSGRDLDDLAMQAADDALVAILGKLDQFRGEARFTTWARRFAALEVPSKIRRRLGHTRETPTDSDDWPPERASGEDPQELSEASELARTIERLIAHQLTAHQREVLLALTIDEVTAKNLAARLDSTPGALYKTLHDARRKLRHELDHEREDHEPSRAEPPSGQPVGGAPTRASGAGCGDALMSGLGAAV